MATPLWQDKGFIEQVRENVHGAALQDWVSDNLNRDIADRNIRKAARRVRVQLGIVSDAPQATQVPRNEESHKHKEDGTWEISIPRTTISTFEELVKHCKIDLKQWIRGDCEFKKWDAGAKDSDNVFQVTQMFAVSAKMKPNCLFINVQAEIDSLKEAALKDMPRFPNIVRERTKGTHLLEVAIMDHHMGKLAYPGSTGGAPWDVNIGEQAYYKGLDDLIYKTRDYDIERILFPIGNDLLHVNGPNNMTFAGTPQDVDGRYPRTFERTRTMICNAIERLREIAPVSALTIVGNHDTTAAWHLGDSVKMYFRKATDVEVLNEPMVRKVFQYKNVFIGMEHGDKAPLRDLHGIYSTRFAPAWGQTVTHEIHCGHRHTDDEGSYKGCKLRIIPSLCAADQWTTDSGYIGVRSAFALCYDHEKWLSTHASTIIDEPMQPSAVYK